MARFKRLDVYNNVIETGLVPLYYHNNLEIMKNVVKACYDGGARVFEFTNRGDFAHEVFAELNKWIEINCPEMIMGVGSIVEPGTCSLYMQLGANFIVSPVLNPEMAKICNRRKIGWMPGCGSLSEINQAEELGAEIVKIFPAKQVGGPAFVKGVTAPCPWSNIMPTGGTSPDPEGLKAWFDAGVCCVGMGSALFSKESIQKKDFTAIEKTVRDTINEIKKIRTK
ncbi:MAG: bifunctional 4-hydroxy-2-oxoglutarate aldolase/2-dehydro-3-deoxy-phosphogluconate aldolase [Bacteroidetes bacterium]|jgi:2-dehydro-3-deoxyphosphogluconate aldolase/(4S)-4-hydroxy-2-oxoglutarate aldolase|nr:bifunctional 4-hydroxy-2-oxoglutarate aldolase/2-dehydro-3-deoxy-phosphogluconate aldolase [Bacteroidota bacterium]